MSTKNDSKQELQMNDNLPTLYIDDIYIDRRTDKMNLVRFTVALPDNIDNEQARIMLSNDDLQRIISNLCGAIDYYPERPSKKKKRVTKKVN